ncbi:MAG: NADAR family protein [Ruminococcus sp.]|nr:NADAR family protein [Ruminococcus sp.]MDE6783906.1 NADAR family protein [Ruminococcus sp.]
MKYTRDSMIKKSDNGEKMKFVFFWGHRPSSDGVITKSCFSQWYDCKFTVDGVEYHTAEQYMMSQKALLFGDEKINTEIMKSGHPNQFKALGRRISGFNEEIWNNNKTAIVIKGNYAKFSQNQELKEFLLNTGNRILVEASPYDKIWGIGMSANNSGIENPNCWNGENLLGFCLMEVRDMILEVNGND